MSAMGPADEMENSDQHMQQMNAFLKKFWREQGAIHRRARRFFARSEHHLVGRDMEELEITTEQSFKTHNDLPLARIKRIMKSDEDVRMISVWARVRRRSRPRARSVRVRRPRRRYSSPKPASSLFSS